jgi:hypothetical protein
MDGLSPQSVFDGILFAGNEGLLDVSFPELHTIGTSLSLLGEPLCKALNLPALDYLGGSLLIPGDQSLVSVDLSVLTHVGSMTINGNQSLLTLGGLPSLTTVDSTLVITENTSLPQCEVDTISSRFAEACMMNCENNDLNGVCN